MSCVIAEMKTAAERHEYDVRIVGETIPSYIDGTLVEIWKDKTYIGRTTLGGLLVVGDKTLALTLKMNFWPRMVGRPDEPWDGDITNRWPTPPAHAPLTIPRTTIGFLEYISDEENRRDRSRNQLNWASVAITHPSIKLKNKPFVADGSAKDEDGGSWAYTTIECMPMGMLIGTLVRSTRTVSLLISMEEVIADIQNQSDLAVEYAPWDEDVDEEGTEGGEDETETWFNLTGELIRKARLEQLKAQQGGGSQGGPSGQDGAEAQKQ
ncbi:hypothetical protein NPX13_g3142 [Xylaria arbuscula]|uniref:Uncharacterized protein n=1 Tax=Xylaria arbuscula TaxID=114810 RepID=A0A9W8NIV7_9PEZI|nr:hypothetical protein NPX13_g3142 [Xylaria arbuscula]